MKSRKALSPVIASIILVAVTVAVSIAVAAWMGALTFSFTSTEQITFTNYAWATPGSTTVAYFNTTIQNTGSSSLSISQVTVDGSAIPLANLKFNNVVATTIMPYSLNKGVSVTIQITQSFTVGTEYNFAVTTSKGHTFGPYTQTAP